MRAARPPPRLEGTVALGLAEKMPGAQHVGQLRETRGDRVEERECARAVGCCQRQDALGAQRFRGKGVCDFEQRERN